MQDTPDTPDERLQRRRVRRWKRHARILGPFLGIPLLLITLSLSVDLVETQPKEEPDRLTDRPIRIAQQSMPPQLKRRQDLFAATQDNDPLPILQGYAERAHRDAIDLDVMLSPTPLVLVRPPGPPPHVVRRR